MTGLLLSRSAVNSFTRKPQIHGQHHLVSLSPIHMVYHLVTIFFITCLSLPTGTFASVWPEPKIFTIGTNSLFISKDVKFTLSTRSNSLLTPESNVTSSSVVNDAIDRTRQKIFEQNFEPWRLHPRNELAKFEPDPQAPKVFISEVTITQTGSEEEDKPKSSTSQIDESYSISISPEGVTKISAPTTFGILHALESFSQLFYEHSTDAGIYTNLAPVTIEDSPKFSHRGLNLDVSRNWIPMEVILKTIDAISMNKFNRLHIHMTDSQSWPLEIPSMPDLALKGAYKVGLSYSPSNLTEIQAYGLRRGVEVIIEIDMPGHTTSIGYTYPDLITGFNAKPWPTYCAQPPCGSLKLNSPAVTKFVENLMADVLPRTSPFSRFFHTGGDEVNRQVYFLDETVKSNEASVLKPLLQKFIDHVHSQLRTAGITPITWEEMAVEWDLNLGSDVIVQSWLSDASVAKITSKGLRVITGNYNSWYLDCGIGQWLNFENGNSFQGQYPFNDYCSPVKNWRLIYSYDPLAGVPQGEQHLVIGGEVHLWTEQVDEVNLGNMLWPRASAAGEVLWSGRQDAAGVNRSQIIAAPRLAEWRERMVKRGISARPITMLYCTQLNATECSL